MITCSQSNVHSVHHINKKITEPVWQQAMKSAIRCPEKLLRYLDIPHVMVKDVEKAAQSFRVFVPLSFADRMEKGNIDDPLLKQVLPVLEEMEQMPGFSLDPLGEKSSNPVKGLLHKYKGRLLVFPSTTCAINCRYCFRRHFPYDENRLNKEEWQNTLSYISENNDIEEVIFSGGDPLAVKDQRLEWLIRQIELIPHVNRLRIHTRLPVVIPERVNETLSGLLKTSRLKMIMVVHCNHPNEIIDTVTRAFSLLKQANVALLNQSVLLKGINDSVDVLRDLGNKLFHSGVLPYYLHLLDKVHGTSHFEVNENDARRLIGKVSESVSGYLVPRLVKEEKGKASKTILSPLYDS